MFFCITKGIRLYKSHSTVYEVFFSVLLHSHRMLIKLNVMEQTRNELTSKAFAAFSSLVCCLQHRFSWDFSITLVCPCVCVFGTNTSTDNNVLMNMHSLIHDSFYKIWNDFVFVLRSASLSLSAFWRDVSGNEWTNFISMDEKKGRKYFISPFKSPHTCKTSIKHFLLEQFLLLASTWKQRFPFSVENGNLASING